MESVIFYEGAANAHGNFGGLIVADIVPDDFSFAPVSDATTDTDYTRTVTITGISAAVAISITGGEYKIGSGDFTSLNGTVTNGQVVMVKVTSGSDAEEETSATLTAGGVSATFLVTTALEATVLGIMDPLTVPIDGSHSGAGWGFGVQSGATLTRENDGTYDYLEAIYPQDTSPELTGANYIFGGWTPEDILQEVYVTIYARMPAYTGGMKFCKFFGGQGGSGYADATFGLDYTNEIKGTMTMVQFGDGTTIYNDIQQGLAFYEPNYQDPGRVGPLTRTIEYGGRFYPADWGTGWHKFQFRWKFNSGETPETEINDGAEEVYIDGVMRSRAINIFNRNSLNEMLKTINYFGHSQGASESFPMHIRRIVNSQNGWVD